MLNDYIGVLGFLVIAGAFSWLVDHSPLARHTLTRAMDVHRKRWMIHMAGRTVRIMDGQIIAGLQNGIAFFASTALLGIGAAFTLLTALDPVIAAVNGFCLGGGCELSLACDIVYASENAKFGQPEVKLGLIPGFGGTQRLARRIGAMRALELVTSARMVGADEAKAIGLCVDVFPQEGLMDAVMKVAGTIAKRAPVAVQVAKAVQAAGVEAPLAVANAYERDAFANLFDTHDAKEGMAAFLEKRSAGFENR